MFGKKRGQRRRRLLRETLIALVGGGIAYFVTLVALEKLSGVTSRLSDIELVISFGLTAIIVMLGYWKESRSGRRLIGAIVGGLLIPLIYIWLAGYDCEPPDDSDLAVQEEVNWGPEQEREFAAFTNVLARAEHLEECNDDIKYERGDVKYERAVQILASNEWVVATLDRVAESDAFQFPPIEIYQYPSVCGVCWLYRNVFPARIKLAAENGEFEKMLGFLDRDLRVGEHYLLHGRSFTDYSVGLEICEDTIDGLRDLVQRNALPDSVLQKIEERVRLIKGFDDALFRAYRNEYEILTRYEFAFYRMMCKQSFGLVSCLFVRYLCQPNRTKAYLCAQIRNEMELLRTGHCVRPADNRTSPWYLMLIDRGWLGKDMMRNLRGRGHDLHETVAAGLALRTQIACKRYEMKYGHRPTDMAALVPEFIPEVPLSPCDGKAVALDLAADKIHIGGCDVEELRIGEPKDK